MMLCFIAKDTKNFISWTLFPIYIGDKLCGEDNPNDLFSPSPSTRVRSQSLNANAMSRPREQVGRYRNKSVSFDPEPKVCEFVEYSKKQLKKMRKQERKQTEIAAKKIEAAAKKAAGKNKGDNDMLYCFLFAILTQSTQSRYVV